MLKFDTSPNFPTQFKNSIDNMKNRRYMLCLLMAILAACFMLLLNWVSRARPPEHIDTKVAATRPGSPGNGDSKRSQSHPVRGNSQKSGDQITPDRAKVLLAEALASSNQMVRAGACMNIIQKLCEAGHAAEAWTLIEKNAGQVRSSELRKFFEAAGLSLEQVRSKIGDLQYAGEASTSIQGYLSSFDLKSLSEMVDNPEFRSMMKELDAENPNITQESLAVDLMTRLSIRTDTNDSSAVVQTLGRLRTEGLLSERGIVDIVREAKSVGVFEKFSILTDTTKDTMTGAESTDLRRNVISQMVQEDPQKALAAISASAGDQASDSLSSAVCSYGTIDPVGANQWYLKNKNSLNTVQQDAVACGFYSLSVTLNEPEIAKAWALGISDPNLKTKLLSEVK